MSGVWGKVVIRASEWTQAGRKRSEALAKVTTVSSQPLCLLPLGTNPSLPYLDIDDFIVDDDGQPLKKPKWRKKLPGYTDA